VKKTQWDRMDDIVRGRGQIAAFKSQVVVVPPNGWENLHAHDFLSHGGTAEVC
jgi:hypothetical protein